MVKTYTAMPDYDRLEILRYAGARGDTDGRVESLLDECLRECADGFAYRVCYTTLSRAEFFDIFPPNETSKTWTDGCENIVVFAATVGLGIDRLINRYASVATAKALLFQAIGAERIETLCDEFCAEYTANGFYAGRRFSPGYGDFPLAAQKGFFTLLNPSKHIGVTLTDSFLMSPTKSVTAAFGIKNVAFDQQNQKEKCKICTQENCAFKKE